MVKEPLPGRVKTRLGAGIGLVQAAWWFRHQTRALIRRLAWDRRWHTVLMVSPNRAGLSSRVWPEGVARQAQGQGNLGDRMARIVRSAGAGPVVIIGADIPGIEAQHVEQAFAVLGDHDAVFGPAPDGGYWLIGWKNARAVPVGFLKNVRWSTQFALEDSVATLKGARIGFVAELQDVDTVEDLDTLRGF